MNTNDYYPTHARSLPATPAKRQAVRELSQVVGGAEEVIATAKTVFPFTLFPDHVTIDRTKITTTIRSFFMVGEVVTIRIEDVFNVVADVGPFFGSLKIWARYLNKQKPYHVNWLRREDALRISRILQGYMMALKNGVDCSQLSNRELATMLDELGQGAARREP